MYRPLCALIIALPLLVGCNSAAPAPPTIAAAPTTSIPKPSPATSPSPSPAAAAPQPASATLTISSPTNGQSVPAGSVAVSVQYNGPPLVPAANATKLDDYHLHYFLNETATPFIGTLVPVPAGNPKIIHTANLQVTFDNVAAGSHTVTVLLSGANHVTVQPPLSTQVTFTAQ